MSENIFNYKIITNGDMAGNLTSMVVDLSRVDGFAVYAEWTAGSAGTIKLQASVDGNSFIDLPNSETSVNGVGNAIWEVTTAFYDKIRVVYTFASGAGTLNVQINGKGDILG